MTGGNPATDRSKPGTKSIVTDKNGTPISAVIIPASTHDIKAVTDVVDNSAVNKQPQQPTSPAITAKSKTIKQHLCLERAHSSKAVDLETIKWGYIPHAPYNGKRGEGKAKDKGKTFQRYHPRRRWVIGRTNS
jgi:hypothetical protein